MVPTLLLAGFVAGLVPRGWIFVIVAAIAWPLLLLVIGVDRGLAFGVAASAVGALNAAAGVIAGTAVRLLVMRVTRR